MEESLPRSTGRIRARTTELLQSTPAADGAADDELIALIYGELREAAGRLLRDERSGHTLQPTALVHEAWVRLVDLAGLPGGSSQDARRRFVALAARAMRNVLIDHARRRGAAKRGGVRRRAPFLDSLPVYSASVDELLDLESALQRLREVDERLGRVAELRILGGLSTAEIAAVVEVAESTARDDWNFARALLAKWLTADES